MAILFVGMERTYGSQPVPVALEDAPFGIGPIDRSMTC